MICPNCKATIDDNSRFCKHCGVEFVDEEEVISLKREVDETAVPYQNAPTAPTVTEGKKDKKTTLMQAIICIVVVALIGGVLIFVGFSTGFIGGEVVTDAAGEEVRAGRGTTSMAVNDYLSDTVKTVESDRSLITPEAVLAKYTEVTNQLKTDAPGFTKINYQNLPTENQNMGSVAKFVLPIIERYVTSKAAADPTAYGAGNADKLPIYDSSYGCLITDPLAIKGCYNEVISDEEYKLVITLVDDMNPVTLPAGATAPQNGVNGMFAPYDAGSAISNIADLSLSNIDFNYTDCTAELVYNPKNNQVKSLTLTMNIDITATIVMVDVGARIVDITEFTNIAYS